MAEEEITVKDPKLIKQVVMQNCQYRRLSDNKIVTAERGDIIELPEVHPNCAEVGTTEDKVDFATAGEGELLESEWTFPEAQEAILKLYSIELKQAPKDKVVAQILDARYRAADIPTDLSKPTE